MGSKRVRLIILAALFTVTFICEKAATRYRLQQKRSPNWSVVPYRFGDWSGFDGRFDPIYGADPADASLLRVYSETGRPPVIAYVGFFRDLATILEVHTPELCYPAQGWTILSSGASAGGTFRGWKIPTSQIVADKNGDRRLVVWWYNAGSRPFETRIRYVYAMLAMSTLTGRTDGSMVRLETPLEPYGEAAARVRVAEFQKIFLPRLDEALPR